MVGFYSHLPLVREDAPRRTHDLPMLGRVLGEGITPAEYYPFWEHHRKVFSAPYRDLVASDVTKKTKRRVRAAVSELTTEQNDRLLLKITGWPRIGFLAEIFEGAKFVHVMRDGRAVINSQLTPTSGTVGAVLRTGVGASYPRPQGGAGQIRSILCVLAAIQWRILTGVTGSAKTSLSKDSFLELKYEDLYSDPLNTSMTVTEFCELEWAAEFERDRPTRANEHERRVQARPTATKRGTLRRCWETIWEGTTICKVGHLHRLPRTVCL
jgi:hypothetical protein